MTIASVSAAWEARRVEVGHGAGFSVLETAGPAPGPTLAVLAGVHGDEPSAVAAARLLRDRLAPLTRGRVMLVPICNEAAWRAAQRRTPDDGGDLARSFPGGDGPTGALAARLTAEVLDEADALVDLHTAKAVNDMAFLAGYIDGLPHSPESLRLAHAFGAELIWVHDECAPGRTLSVAAARGIPAFYAEGPGGGAVVTELAERYADGVGAIARALGLAEPAGSTPSGEPTVVRSDGDLERVGVRAQADGLLVRCTVVGAFVRAGELLARVVDPIGGRSTDIRADLDGVVVLIGRERSIVAGVTAAVVAPPAGRSRP